jgi:hypothetical protein
MKKKKQKPQTSRVMAGIDTSLVNAMSTAYNMGLNVDVIKMI